jgi:intein/homing endonuclease
MQQKIRDYIIPENYDIFKSWRPEQHFQRLDKYSNYLWEEFRLETWEEVIARATDTLRWISKDKLDFPHYQKIFDLMYRLEVMPSMRLLSMSQAAIERCNTVLYNCTAGLGDTLTSIAEAQYLSMSGSGVTWSVERQNVNKIPAIKPKTGMMFYHRVKDTQIGWAESTKLLLNELAHGNDVTMNYEEIRPYGAPLKTKGGYASGPEILIKTHDFIRETFKNAQGRKLRPIEMHDMFCFALESGVSGGVRRCLSEDTEVITNNGLMKIKDIIPGDLAWTPEGYKKITNIFEQGKQAVTKITLSNGTTVEATENHRLAVVTKNGYEWRYVSEISLSDKLLLNGVEAKSGKNIEINIDIPGEHSHATTKLTKDYFTIDEDFAWMFGKFLADGCVMHRVKNGVDFKRGISIATHTNEEVQREKLYNFFSSFGVNVVNAESKGENCFHTNIVNGQIGRTFGDFKTAKTNIRIPHFIKESPASVRAAFLAGLADGDGCLHTKNIVLVHTIYDTLRDDVINLYASLGIVAHSKTTIRKNGWKNIHKVSVKGLSNKKNLVALLSPFTTKKIYDFKLNMYDYNANGVLLSNMPDKRLVPVEISSIEREYKIVETFDIEVEEVHCFFANGVLSHNSAGMCIFDADETDILTCKYDGFWNHPIHKVRANANNSAVWSENLSKADVEDLTRQMFSTESGEPGLFKRDTAIKTSPSWREFLHPESVIVNPCSEIVLNPYPIDSPHVKNGGWQFCNLSSINVRHDDNIQSLMEKTYYATIIGDIQSLATEFEFLRSGTKTICDKDRLLGVNLVGHATAPIIRNNERLVKELQAVTVETDLIFAKQFNVNRSAALGSVKPSGNHSVLCYTAPGGNPIHSIYQIRNVTVNKNSAMHLFLESQGVPFKDYPGRDYASMFAFPIEYPEDSLTLDNTGAIAQLENWKYLKVNWCHHNPSVSVTYVPEEKEEIIDWLYQNQDIIGGLAFFPKYESSYELLPIVSVSKERYDEFTKDYPIISWEYYRLYETAVDDRQQVAECVGGQCVIV